jgi:hypothetical protein
MIAIENLLAYARLSTEPLIKSIRPEWKLVKKMTIEGRGGT